MSSEISSDAISSSSDGIGALLHQKREAMGWTIEAVADHLKIRPSILKNLEEENYAELPGQVYLLGFLKNYAAFLGLDAEKILQDFSQKKIDPPISSRVKISDVDFLQRNGARQAPIGFFVGIGFLLTLGIYGGWYYLKGHDLPLHHLSSFSIPQTEQQNMGQNSREKSASQIQKQVLPPPPSVTEQKNLPSETHSENNTVNLVIPPSQTASSPFVKHEGQAQKDSGQSVQNAQKGEEQKIFILHAQEDSWVLIRDAQKKTVFSALLKKGAQWQSDATQGIYYLTAGNAGGVYFQIGSLQTPALGKMGFVRRDLEVSAEKILAGDFGVLTSSQDLEHHDNIH